MALLGRISAVLTANTQDFTRQIGTARREIQDFARQARGVQFNLNTRSLDGTLTQLQRFQRTIREIQQLQARGVDAGLPNANRLRDQFRAFEDIGRPLTAVKNQIEGLSNTVQAELYPALERVQAGFRNFYSEIETGATTFDRSAARVENLQRRITALGRATAAAGDFSNLAKSLNANNTGASFFQPRARESLQRSLELRNQAQNVPARLRGDVFADLSVDAERNADEIERAAARVAAAQLRIADYGETPSNLARRGRAQQDLDRLTNRQGVINASFQRELTSAQIQQVVSPDAERQVDRLRARFETLANELRQLGGTRFNGLIAGVGSVVEQLNRGTASAKEARQAVESLAAAASSVNIGRNLASQTDSLLNTPVDLQRRQIQSNFDRQASRLPQNDPAREGLVNDRDNAMTRLRLNSEIIPRTQGLADSAKGFGDPKLEQQANRLLQYNREISAELRRQDNLNANKNYDAAAASLRTINRLLSEQSQLEEEIAGDISTANAARRQTELFLRASGRSSEKLSQGARDAASDLDVGAQFRGGIKDGGARIRIEAEMMRIEESVRNLQKAMAAVAASDLGADEKAAELDRLDNQVRQSTGGLAEFIAAESDGVYGKDQIASAMKRGRNSAGSFGVGGAASAQLALQQGLFAVDDFISSTGGLEYKLRAVGNNITQLGLLLGQSGLIRGLNATTGLFVGLAAVLSVQGVLAFTRWVNGGRSAEDQTKALNDALSRQKSLVEELARSFESLGDSIARKAFSGGAQNARDFAKTLEALSKKQKELTESRVADLDPAVQTERGNQAVLKRRLDNATDGGQRVAILREIEDSRARERAAANAAASRPAPTADDVRAGVLGSIRATEFLEGGRLTGFSERTARRRQAAAERELANAGNDPRAMSRIIEQRISDRQQVAGRDINAADFFSGEAAEISRAREDVAALTTLLESLRLPSNVKVDEDIRRILKASNNAATGIEQAQKLAESSLQAGIPAAVGITETLNKLGEEIDRSLTAISRAQADFAEGGITAEERDSVVAREGASISDGRARRAQAEQAARDLNFSRIVDPQVLTGSRLSRIGANLSSAGLESGVLARRARELEARAAQAQVDSTSNNPFTRMRSAGEMKAVNEESAALEAATMEVNRFAEALSRATSEAESNLNAATQREEEARRNFLMPTSNLYDEERVPDAVTAARIKAQKDLEDQQLAQAEVRRRVEGARERLEFEATDPANPLLGTFAELRKIEEDLSSGALDENKRRGLLSRRNALRDEIDKFVELDGGVQTARDESTALEEKQKAENRGIELALTPAQRAGRDLARNLSDVQAAFQSRAPGLQTQEEYDKTQKRVLEDSMRQTAPAIFGMADQVMNAVLQGPSRAALQASDITTSQGASELSRLLRGDDSAKDQNLVELQKQSTALEELVTIARENGAPPGVFD